MLRKAKTSEKEKTFTSSEITGEEKSLLISDAGANEEKTIIGEQISIEGSIRGEEHLLLNGFMQGKVELKNHSFTIGSKGRFEGDIHAKNVSVSGQMNGTIKAQGNVEITKEADFMGDIMAKGISVEDGAYFKGTIELERQPNRKAAPPEAPKSTAELPPAKEPTVRQAKV